MQKPTHLFINQMQQFLLAEEARFRMCTDIFTYCHGYTDQVCIHQLASSGRVTETYDRNRGDWLYK